MYTRCPQCQTVFRFTAAQLKARGGQVRCGRCQHVFRADRHLVERPAPAAGPRKRAVRKGQRPPVAPATVVESAPPRTATAEPAPVTAIAEEPAPPHAAAPLSRAAPAQTRSAYWSLGILAAVLALLAQTVIFYGADLVRNAPVLRATVALVCRGLPCQRLAPIDMHRLDLVETQVTPHPRYDRALRVRATIVNRADRAQPYPLLEVTLMDSQGNVVARRAYSPRDYLGNPQAIADGLPPQVAVTVQLDITSPGPQASGFEILLLPPTE